MRTTLRTTALLLTPPATPTAALTHGSSLLLIIVAGAVFLIMLALALICLCRSRLRARDTDGIAPSLSEQFPATAGNSIADLIPPLFYTEDLRDPLLQDDLRDRVATRRASDAFSPRGL
jgi:hypothetical protein